MNPLRQLASQTAVYGLSSIVGRLLNYLLVPLHTRVFAPEAFGVVTEMYSYVAFLLVVLTYGFETAFFRFARDKEQEPAVYSTALVSLAGSSALFVGVIWLFASPLAAVMGYSGYEHYLLWFALILALDAITAIPFARLRLQQKPLRFAAFRLINIGINIALNLFWLLVCPMLAQENTPVWLELVYDPSVGVGYVFLANLIASVVSFLLLLPDMLRHEWKLSKALWLSMLAYGLPLLVGGLAGITNEMFSRVSMKYQLEGDDALYQLGIFGACYKVSVLMTLFVQTFRFAAEPFFFSRAADKNAPGLYATVMHWFIIACSAIYLGVMLCMEYIAHFVGEEYREGLGIVPVLLMANLLLGVYYNLSIWYKLNDRTGLGAWMAVGGALLTIALNFLWIPQYGYVGAAWATLVVYLSMVVVSYFLGARFYPIPYKLFKCLGYPLAAVGLALLFGQISGDDQAFNWLFRVLILLVFVAVVFKLEDIKKPLPSPGSKSANKHED